MTSKKDQSLGPAVRTVKRRNPNPSESVLVATVVEQPGSELLEKVDPSRINAEMAGMPKPERKRRVRKQPPPVPANAPALPTEPPATTAVAFVRQNYFRGRSAAAVVRDWVPYALALSALCTAGFLEGLVTFGVCSIFAVLFLLVGFLSGLVARVRQYGRKAEPNNPNTDEVVIVDDEKAHVLTE